MLSGIRPGLVVEKLVVEKFLSRDSVFWKPKKVFFATAELEGHALRPWAGSRGIPEI